MDCERYPQPASGGSLILAFRLQSKTTLIIGSNTLAANRAFAALEAESDVIVLAPGGEASACDELQWRMHQKQLSIVDMNALHQAADFAAEFRAYLDTLPNLALVCVTDSLAHRESNTRRSYDSAKAIFDVCRSCRILVNITDVPELCDFTLPAAHRFADLGTGRPSPLQIAITTNGQGCRLGGRLRREIISSLPQNVGGATERLGRMRQRAKLTTTPENLPVFQQLDKETSESLTPNTPVPQRSIFESPVERLQRRMRWVAQMSEYWPIEHLARLQDSDIDELLDSQVIDGIQAPPTQRTGHSTTEDFEQTDTIPSQHGLLIEQPKTFKGRVFLVGSGPGHPSLLTVATLDVLTKRATVVLSDKLVPASVLDLIPKHVKIHIAKKFPGNADNAQNEMMQIGVEAASRGETVVRLKQGDPMVYGRAGEEVLYFRSHGFEPVVIPGVTSAIAGPTFAGIPVTQRGVSDSLTICTGVGRHGKDVYIPGYERSRTLVILMGVARLKSLLEALLSETSKNRNGLAYPSYLPIAIVERASMPDQRVLVSTLTSIAEALEVLGEQRPPGMIVIGWSVLALHDTGFIDALDNDDILDHEVVEKWLSGKTSRTFEGLVDAWDQLS
ncbi:uroporphyrin-III C-methyltransferase [Sistotremastrum suecicum HHB10207 ss-3]|uniref:precorrin-2 dehydrogenase n=1 Tax=Sistotremastrum suecicum HHB10207 ss-3 TaxID=1314776 RepID=A0A166HDD7_9AGAM|nr:uroporphyrin-III C-methyltransferase [Sistotremastrum suecicum HHB10207 ss-3]